MFRDVREVDVTITFHVDGAPCGENEYWCEGPTTGDHWPLTVTQSGERFEFPIQVDDPSTVSRVHLICDGVLDNGELVDAALECRLVRATPVPVAVVGRRIVTAKRRPDGSLEATYENAPAETAETT